MQENISLRRILFVSTVALVLDVSILPVQAQSQLFCPGGLSFNKGVCQNPLGSGLGNSFSTAALSSQSLSEVSQTVTEQSTYAAFAAVKERRDQEAVPP